MLWSPVITSLKCGSPPVCKCFPSLKVIECRQVSKVPNFLSEQTEAVKTLILSGNKIIFFPQVVTTWISLEKIVIEETGIPCDDVMLAAETYEQIEIISKCVQTTVKSIIVTGFPNEENTETFSNIPTNVNNITFWLMMNASSTKLLPSTSSVTSGDFNWFDYGIVLTCLTVFSAVVLITCFILRRYRRQHGIIARRHTRRRGIGKTIIEEDMATIVESLGPINDDNTSFESLELFSVPPKTSKYD